MNKAAACLDGPATTNAVIEWAAWSARRLNMPLELLHGLERHPERAQGADFTGAIGLGARESILHELSELDEKRGKLALEARRHLLLAARERAATAGVIQLDSRLRHGELLDTVLELQPYARRFVLGAHHHAL